MKKRRAQHHHNWQGGEARPKPALLIELQRLQQIYDDCPNISRDLYTAYTDLKARVDDERPARLG